MTGTVTTGIEGLSAMSLVAHNLTSKKCVAMLQHAIVSLVADVKCASNNAVITTIDSSISPGDVFVSVDGEDTPQRVSVGTVGKEFANVDWIHHNRTGYFTTFADAPYRSIEITHAMVSSTNRRILFEAGFNHGTNVTGLLEHAGWITVPGVSLAQMQAGVRPNVTVVSNTKETQAVMDHAKSQGMAAIWTRGASVAFPPPLFSVSSSSPATIIVTKLADGSVNITAADPSNDKDGLSCTLCCPSTGWWERIASHARTARRPSRSTCRRVGMRGGARRCSARALMPRSPRSRQTTTRVAGAATLGKTYNCYLGR